MRESKRSMMEKIRDRNSNVQDFGLRNRKPTERDKKLAGNRIKYSVSKYFKDDDL